MWVNVFVRHVCSVFICGRGESISGMYVFMSKKSHYDMEGWLKEMIVVRVVILACYYFERQPVVGQIAVFAD